jgi:hypothetical protein
LNVIACAWMSSVVASVIDIRVLQRDTLGYV